MFRIIKSAEISPGDICTLSLRDLYTPGGTDPVSGNGSGGRQEGGQLRTEAEAAAREVLARARAEADEIIMRAREEAEAIAARVKEEAYAEGLARGLAEGKERGYREGMDRAVEEAARLREEALLALRGAEEARRRLLLEIEREVVDLAVEIAEKVLCKELEQDRDAVLVVAREALSLVAGRKSAYLFVNPQDLPAAEGARGELAALLGPKALVEVIADPAVERGGLRVETERGDVDATLSARWKEILAALKPPGS